MCRYCEIRVTEDLRALIRVLLSDLLGVVVNREKGQLLIEKLKQFIWNVCQRNKIIVKIYGNFATGWRKKI